MTASNPMIYTRSVLPDRDTLVIRLRAALPGDEALHLAVLFGSAATGRTWPGSDVDVAVLASPALDEPQLTLRLTLAAGAEVDLVRIETASTLLRWNIAKDGIALFEHAPGEFPRFRARAAAEYIDFAPALAHYGEIFRQRLIEQGTHR